MKNVTPSTGFCVAGVESLSTIVIVAAVGVARIAPVAAFRFIVKV
jgi:hypothetical protein